MFMNEREDIAAYIATLKAAEGLDGKAIRDDYLRFNREKDAQEPAVNEELRALEQQIGQAKDNAFLKELGLPLLP